MQKKRNLTLLEIILVITILITVGGVVFWRLDRFVAQRRLATDANVLKQVFLHAHSLALHSQTDVQISIEPSKTGWAIALHRPEDPTAQPLRWPSSLGRCNLFFNQKQAQQLTFQCYSSGPVLPTGTLELTTDTQKATISFPTLFKQL